MGLEPLPESFNLLSQIQGPLGLPGHGADPLAQLSVLPPVEVGSGVIQMRFTPTFFGIADAAASLILEENRYRYRKHLDQALLASKSEHLKFLERGVEAARTLSVPEAIQDHLCLVFDSFFFSDDLNGKITPDADDRALLSALYQEANRAGSTQAYWGGNPDLDQAIKEVAGRMSEVLGPLVGVASFGSASVGTTSPQEPLHLCLLSGLLIRPLARHFLAETFGAESKPATEEGSVGNAALDVAKSVVYQILADLNLLAQTPQEIQAQLRQLDRVDIRTTYITPDFPAEYAGLLVHLSYVVRDLQTLFVDWRTLLLMDRLLEHPSLAEGEEISPPPFVEAAIPLTAVGVLQLDERHRGARGVLFQGKVRGGFCCLTKAEGPGITFQDPLVDANRSWSLPGALGVSIDSEGKIFGSHDGRLSRVVYQCGSAERVTRVAHAIHHEAKRELDRFWEKFPQLFHIIDKHPFSLLLCAGKRRVLLTPELAEPNPFELVAIGSPLKSAEIADLLLRVGIESSFSMRGIELESESTQSEAPPSSSDPAPATVRVSVSGHFVLHGNRRFSKILAVLHQNFGVEERRGKGSHSILIRNEHGFPLPHRVRDDTAPFPLSYLKPLLRRLAISESEFVQAISEE